MCIRDSLRETLVASRSNAVAKGKWLAANRVTNLVALDTIAIAEAVEEGGVDNAGLPCSVNLILYVTIVIAKRVNLIRCARLIPQVG